MSNYDDVPHNTLNVMQIDVITILRSIFKILYMLSLILIGIYAIPAYHDSYVEDNISPEFDFLTISQNYSYPVNATVVLPCKINISGEIKLIFNSLEIITDSLWPS